MKKIHPIRDKKWIRLRFTVEGVKFCFSPLPGAEWENVRDRKMVEAIAEKISLDILAGNFDPTLRRYRHKSSETPVVAPKSAAKQKTWLSLWDDWVASLSVGTATLKDHYHCCRRMIENAGNPVISQIDWVFQFEISASTFNRRLSMLRSAVAYGIKTGAINTSPLEKIKNRKASLEEEETTEAKKAPLNAQEVTKIINYFQERHPNYAPFVEFLLFSGVRTGEAVGLRWKDINLDKQTIQIQQSISRERGGYKKVRKRPKTLQSLRSLRMSDRIYELFLRIKPEQVSPDELIFKSSHGCIIDHGNFRSQYWKPALEKLNIPYRKPYATRHTLLSEALESGLTIPQVAAIAGHKDGRMILQHYGRQISAAKLPE